MATPVLQFKRGLIANLPGLRAGEPGFTTDSYDLYVGIDSTTNNNKFFGSHRYWTKETTSTGSGVRFVERTDGGSNYIEIKAPDTALAGNVSLALPATQGAPSSVLTNDGSGNLSWSSGSANPVFSGIATFTDTTDNTLGNPDTGSVQIDGGLGINKNLTVGAGLSVVGNAYVAGVSTFVGSVTFNGGTIVLGDNTSDDINVGGEFVSNLIPNTTNQYDLGTSTQKWRNLWLSGNLNVAGVITSTYFNDLLINSKDIVTAYTDGVSETDNTANHGGLAVASNEGSPLIDISVAGINTLPSTYKQIMWVKSGTFTGLATDAWMFNYGVAIGTTTMANGVRLAVGTGVTISDTSVSATNFYGALSGNASSSDQVKTVTASNTNATYHITFVDSHNGSATNETVYTDDGIYYNPGTNTFTTQYGYFTGNVTVDGTITGTATTASRATSVDVAGVASNQNYYITLVDGSGNSKSVGVDAELLYNPNTNKMTVPTINVGTLNAADGVAALTLTSSTGNVGVSSNLTVNGNLYVLGSTTEVNTETLKVEDSLIEVGLVNSGGTLVAPVSDSNIDVGIIFHYYTSSAKKAGIYWDDSVSRVVVGSDLSETSSVITATTYAPVEVGALWVNDCAGQSQVISCTGSERFLENITIDCGSF